MKIGILGHGVVGQGVTRIIADNGYGDITIGKILVKDEREMLDERFTLKVEDILDDESIDTIVECMGGDEPAHTYVYRALKAHKNVVSANKKMLARHLDLFALAADNGVKLLAEASCGGGIPWLINIRRLRRSDQISSFKGIINGTTNYLLSRLFKEESDFDRVLKDAQNLGYAERDPGDDIGGYDVAYKVCISIMEAFGYLVDASEILCLGISNIQAQDIAYARKQDKVIKLIGSAVCDGDKLNASVLPLLLSKDTILANVGSNFNYLSVSGDHLGEAAFYGQGAGSLPTGQAIVMDLCDLKDDDSISKKRALIRKELADDRKARFYIRHKDSEKMSVYVCEKISDHSFISELLSIGELKDLLLEYRDEDCFVMEVADD